MYTTLQEITTESLQKNCTHIHYFGLGFIQIKLGETYRIHFYTDQLPAIAGEEDVHNHRYDFRSKILYGNFKQELFEITPGGVYVLEDESCKKNVTSEASSQVCSVKKIGEQNFIAGSEYTLDKDTYHRVYSNNANHTA